MRALSLALALSLLSGVDGESVRAITAEKGKLIELRVSSSTVTSIAFDHPFKLENLICGNDATLIKKVSAGNTQLNLSATQKASNKTRSNCNLTFDNLDRLAFIVEVVDKSPDLFVEVTLPGGPSDPSKPKRSACAAQDLEEAAFAADAARKLAHWSDLAKQAATGIVYSKLRARENADGIIFALHEYNRLGDQCFVRFSIENRTRHAWQPAKAEVQFYKDGQAEKLEKNFGVAYDDDHRSTGLIIAPGEELFGSITFEGAGFAANSKFRFQVFEMRGTRHPVIDKVEF